MKHCGSIILRGEWKSHSGDVTKTQSGGHNTYWTWDLTPTTHSAIIPLQRPIVMDYRPYSPEWHRRRYLKEALDKYFDDYVDTDTIREDLLSILSERSDKAYADFMRINELERALQ
jgi:hypothetical protein